jgi:exopolysaccharide biosynthesis polyprenyl glycosylphosphotransferase
MNETKRLLWLNSLKMFDIASLIVSFVSATILSAVRAGNPSIVEVFSVKVKLWNFVIFVALLAFWHLVFKMCGLYRSKRLSTTQVETIDTLKGAAIATLSLVVAARILNLRMFTPTFLILFWAFSASILVIGRLVGRFVLSHLRRQGRNLHFILILGTNARAIEFARKLEARPELGYQIVGFVDDPWTGTDEFSRSGYRLCCDFENLPRFLRDNVVDEVGFFLPLRSFYEFTSRVATLFEQHGTIMRFDSDMFNLKSARPRIDVVDGEAHITAYSGRFEGLAVHVKRLIDLTGSFVLLTLLTPLFLLVAILIKATSAGPLMFSQKRVGLNKRQFVMYKFRTMVSDAEQLQSNLLHLNEMTGPVFKIKNDPRVTRVGRFLRKTSIDELPQLFNVLMGDMSLVGPRAMSVRDYQFFSEDWQRRRFSVRPGITCLWQVNGRNSIPFEQWMELDMQYIDGWSLWLDLKILAQTIPAVLKGSGAA